MSSDLIQSMDTFPVRADVDGELHAEIRLTNHRRIFLKRAYQKDDHGNDATDGDRVAGRTRSKDNWQAIVDVLTSGKPKETFNYLKKRRFRLDRPSAPADADPVVYRNDKIVPYCEIVFDIIHSAWVACLERDRQSGGTLSDCNSPSIAAVFEWISHRYVDINRVHVCLFLETKNAVEMLPLNGKVNVFFDQLKSTSKAMLRQKDKPIAEGNTHNKNDNDNDEMEDDDDVDLFFLDDAAATAASPDVCEVPYFACHLQCKICSLNQEPPLLTLYDDEPLATALCADTSSWWPRPFIQTYAKLLLHSFHAPNASTDVVIFTPKSSGRVNDRLFRINPNTKYLFHVAMNSRRTFTGDHYAVVRVDIGKKSIDIYEGKGYRCEAFQSEIKDLLNTVGLDPDLEWKLCMRKIFDQGKDNNNCGPIACATLEILLASESACENFDRWQIRHPGVDIDWQEMRSKIVNRYGRMRKDFSHLFYFQMRPKWIKKNEAELKFEYIINPGEPQDEANVCDLLTPARSAGGLKPVPDEADTCDVIIPESKKICLEAGDGRRTPLAATTPVTKRAAESLVAIAAKASDSNNVSTWDAYDDEESIVLNNSLTNGEVWNDNGDEEYDDSDDEEWEAKPRKPLCTVLVEGEVPVREYTADMKCFHDGPRRKYPDLMQETVKKATTSMSSYNLRGMEEAYSSFKSLFDELYYHWPRNRISDGPCVSSVFQRNSLCKFCFEGMMGDQQPVTLPWTPQHRDMWRRHKDTGRPEDYAREKIKEEGDFDISDLHKKLDENGVFSGSQKSRRVDLIGKDIKYWARWNADETFSLFAFVFHELHPSDINLCFWETGVDFPDVAGNLHRRFLIIIVCRNGEFYHHVIDTTRKEWDVFDSNKDAEWSHHTDMIDDLKEELPRPFGKFRIVLNNPAKSNIYWRQGHWMSAPATVVKFVETLIRLSTCHHVVFQGHRSTERLLQDQWNQLGSIKCDTHRLRNQRQNSIVWDLEAFTNKSDDVIFEYVTGKLIDSFLSQNCISVRTYAFVKGNDPRSSS